MATTATRQSVPSWHGTSEATEAHHNEVFERYGMTKLPCYRFRVSDYLDAVELDHSKEAANGIWTLAEIRATGESWRRVAALARRMLTAIKHHEAGTKPRRQPALR